MNIVKATHRFEEWLGRHTPLVKPDLRLKHQRMAEAVFPFLRATFYRWMQIWPDICSDLAKAPHVLAVGDLHVENFGTWRDIEGRLVWGVNDFDEAAVLPYTIDLVRLATSTILAVEAGHLRPPAERRLHVDSARRPRISFPRRPSLCSRRRKHVAARAGDWHLARSCPFLEKNGRLASSDRRSFGQRQRSSRASHARTRIDLQDCPPGRRPRKSGPYSAGRDRSVSRCQDRP